MLIDLMGENILREINRLKSLRGMQVDPAAMDIIETTIAVLEGTIVFYFNSTRTDLQVIVPNADHDGDYNENQTQDPSFGGAGCECHHYITGFPCGGK